MLAMPISQAPVNRGSRIGRHSVGSGSLPPADPTPCTDPPPAMTTWHLVNLDCRRRPHCGWLVLLTLLLTSGCGTTLQRSATEQLLASDAIDRTIAQIDFSLLADRKVYLDPQYILMLKDVGFVNAPYVISSLRQQLSAAGCRIQDTAASADYIVEARVGALGTDSHDVTYGLPPSNALAAAASALPNLPALPTIPEISVAKRNDQAAAAKLAVFAYHRETRTPVWQSGIAMAHSSARDTWVLGAGPIQRGSIHDGVLFAGTKLPLPFLRKRKADPKTTGYASAHQFTTPDELETMLARAKSEKENAAAEVQQAGHATAEQ